MSRACVDERQARLVVSLIERGKAAARVGKKAEARYLFGAVVEMVPDHPDALLWLAYLAGGGRPSLAYLARLLEADPTNQRARAAIRWARKHVRPKAGTPLVLPHARPSGRSQRLRGALLGLLVLVMMLVGGLATAAFALGRPPATPTRAQRIAAVASATSLPSDTPPPTPSATPTESPSPTATPTPSHMPTATATARLPRRAVPGTATPTATEPPPTPTPAAVPAPQVPSPHPTVPPPSLPTVPVGDNFRWIDVDLTNQRLTAYEGETAVRTVIVSTGLPRTPTVTGRFQIFAKYRTANMSGPGYFLRNVPHVMYFYRGYGLHGTYWHSSFGQPMSHGCVNLPTPDAEWLYNWASVGTLVVVHH
jgi:lipoprotein-anchoring transpeptidase ErfK/SrfK